MQKQCPDKITATEVYIDVRRLFTNYEYKLQNSYVYDWESDFFAISKSGYTLEVEVKVSRSDYFKDFEKPKHVLFQSHVKKLSHHIFREPAHTYSYSDRDERLICKFLNPVINWYKPQYRDWRKGDIIVNDHSRVEVRHETIYVLAPATSIKIKPIESILCPNSFYYACPDGLIKPEEIPAYAGLIYGDRIIKKAPYIHKGHQDLTKILLQKFYYLYLNKGTV